MSAVFLVGFMGAGKSSVGLALADRLGWPFEDLDSRIERDLGCSIAEIFRASGEAEFRRLEREMLQKVLQELTGDAGRVVGLGGGAFAQSENAALLESSGVLTIFLDAPAEELWRRCVKQAQDQGLERPLLQSFEQFRKLFESRLGSYRKAVVRIETGGRTVTEIVNEISEMSSLKNLHSEKEG
jgi:shikimate kinase